jgi:hypothetical protein
MLCIRLGQALMHETSLLKDAMAMEMENSNMIFLFYIKMLTH